MLYSLSNLRKSYEDKVVLDIPFLEIEKGTIYGLLGPNGAGKTTLLKILGFLEPPTSGNIIYESDAVRFNESFLQDLRKTVVLVDQKPILFSTSVYKNVEFGLKVRGVPKRERSAIIEEVLDLVGMGQFLHTQATTLSGGETQRIAIAQALAVLPNVLLCDEPTPSVDMENQIKILNILKQVNENKKITVIFTSHDHFQAVCLARHIIYLDQGRMTTSGYDNRFPAVLIAEDHQQVRCRIQDSIEFLIPTEQIGARTGKVQLMIDPEKVTLCRREKKFSDIIYWEGKVVQVMDEKGKIRVVTNLVDHGLWISTVITPVYYRESGLLVGERVYVSIPTDSIRIV